MTDVPESMFPPGSTPYGPPAGAVPVAAPQPYVAAPAAWTSPPVAPRPRKNGFGVAAVWIGALSLLLSLAGLSVTWLFALVAIVFGVIALIRVDRPRTAGIIGLTLASFGLLVGILVTVSRY